MLYYELFGLPGAGKTTVALSVVKHLRDKGYRVALLEDIYGNGVRGHRLEMLFSLSEYRLYYYICRLYGKSCKKHISFLKKLLHYSHQILKTTKENKYDIIFLEEGIIQYISSLFYLEDIPDNKILGKIVSYLTERVVIEPIFCYADISTSMKRIKERPYKQTARYSFFVGQQTLEEALTHRLNNLHVISSYFPSHITINMKRPADENALLLISIIENRIGRTENKS